MLSHSQAFQFQWIHAMWTILWRVGAYFNPVFCLLKNALTGCSEYHEPHTIIIPKEFHQCIMNLVSILAYQFLATLTWPVSESHKSAVCAVPGLHVFSRIIIWASGQVTHTARDCVTLLTTSSIGYEASALSEATCTGEVQVCLHILFQLQKSLTDTPSAQSGQV